VPAELAGAFLNLEPVVGAAAGWLALGEPATVWQIVGVGAVLVGVAMSTAPPRPADAREPVVRVAVTRLAYKLLTLRP
jgi:drug/metabolite transporter (DMT)-like permease